jgi:hypothetical protein
VPYLHRILVLALVDVLERLLVRRMRVGLLLALTVRIKVGPEGVVISVGRQGGGTLARAKSA